MTIKRFIDYAGEYFITFEDKDILKILFVDKRDMKIFEDSEFSNYTFLYEGIVDTFSSIKNLTIKNIETYEFVVTEGDSYFYFQTNYIKKDDPVFSECIFENT